MLKDYIQLTKPGIIIGNLITAVGGFFLGLTAAFNTISFLAMFFGLTFVIAAGCVLNNIQDRAIDERAYFSNSRIGGSSSKILK